MINFLTNFFSKICSILLINTVSFGKHKKRKSWVNDPTFAAADKDKSKKDDKDSKADSKAKKWFLEVN